MNLTDTPRAELLRLYRDELISPGAEAPPLHRGGSWTTSLGAPERAILAAHSKMGDA